MGTPRNKEDENVNAKVISDVTDWAKWSLTPHTEEEIREKVLTDYDNVCFTYVCGTSLMSAEFLEELMALSTGLLDKSNYDEYYEDVLKGVHINMGVEVGELDKLSLPKIYVKNKTCQLSSKPGLDYLYSKLDWWAISQRKDLPIWFRLKYAKQLNIKDKGNGQLEE
jgi:hypothetical protein